jgi:hypothetical protein
MGAFLLGLAGAAIAIVIFAIGYSMGFDEGARYKGGFRK